MTRMARPVQSIRVQPVSSLERLRGRLTSGNVGDRVVYWGYVMAPVAVLVQGASHLTNVLVFDGDISTFSADEDGNTFAWASSVATYTAALMAFALAFLDRRRRGRMLVLAALLAFFSLDDILRVHEWVEGQAVERLETLLSFDPEYGRLIWPLLFFPMLATAFIVLWQLSRTLAGEPARAIRIGLGLLVLGVLAEAASAAIHVEERFAGGFIDGLEVAVEEGAELAGWILIATALTATVVQALRSNTRPRHPASTDLFSSERDSVPKQAV
jgi:hypothetical protein